MCAYLYIHTSVNAFMDKYHVQGKKFKSWSSFTASPASGGLLTVMHEDLANMVFTLWPKEVREAVFNLKGGERQLTTDLFTCFANPVHVPVHLLLQLLLLLQEQEAGPRLHPVLLLRKLAV